MTTTAFASRAALVGAAAALLLAAPATAGSKPTFVQSANGRVSCQLSSGGALGKLVYCQTTKPASSATLHSNGFVKICKGVACLGQPPENVKTLRAGKDAQVGPFDCFAAVVGTTITCTVSKTGKGFAVSASGIKKITLPSVGQQ